MRTPSGLTFRAVLRASAEGAFPHAARPDTPRVNGVPERTEHESRQNTMIVGWVALVSGMTNTARICAGS